MRSFGIGARNGGCADRGDHAKVPISWSGTGATELRAVNQELQMPMGGQNGVVDGLELLATENYCHLIGRWLFVGWRVVRRRMGRGIGGEIKLQVIIDQYEKNTNSIVF